MQNSHSIPPIDSDRLLARFLRYVAIDTRADPDGKSYPSSPGQLTLSKLLADELTELGLADVSCSRFGIVMGTLRSNVHDGVPVVAFNSHVDTSPEASGANVRPQVIRNYQGGDIRLPGAGEMAITLAENPELESLLGCTLVTTDGTTLLGGDDKAGIAIIMEAMATFLENQSVAHGDVRVLFTCDEEIGHGVDHVNLELLNAAACYTLDGPGAGTIDVETFSADGAIVTFQGINIHPSIAKDRMINAVRAAASFVSQLPLELAPETTCDRAGFMHPYDVSGGVDQVVVKLILRDFEEDNLRLQADRLRTLAASVSAEFRDMKITVDVKPQYRNMREGLAHHPQAVELAEEAHRRLGMEVRRESIRGGTDGSQLTARGLPTPNLSSGQHNPHSPLEWVCLDQMAQATQVVLQLANCWAERHR